MYIYIYTHVIQCTHTYTDPKWRVSDPMTGNVAHSYLTTSMASPFWSPASDRWLKCSPTEPRRASSGTLCCGCGLRGRGEPVKDPITYFEAKALQKKIVFSDGPGSFHLAVQISSHFGHCENLCSPRRSYGGDQWHKSLSTHDCKWVWFQFGMLVNTQGLRITAYVLYIYIHIYIYIRIDYIHTDVFYHSTRAWVDRIENIRYTMTFYWLDPRFHAGFLCWNRTGFLGIGHPSFRTCYLRQNYCIAWTAQVIFQQ